jgi:hypothetical protein
MTALFANIFLDQNQRQKNNRFLFILKKRERALEPASENQ